MDNQPDIHSVYSYNGAIQNLVQFLRYTGESETVHFGSKNWRSEIGDSELGFQKLWSGLFIQLCGFPTMPI